MEYPRLARVTQRLLGKVVNDTKYYCEIMRKDPIAIKLYTYVEHEPGEPEFSMKANPILKSWDHVIKFFEAYG